MPITAIDTIWTTLPAGRSGGSLRLTVFVSPRVLVPAQTTCAELAGTPLENWPSTLLATALDEVPFAFRQGNTTSQIVGPCVSLKTLSPALWSALFQPSTRLGSGAFQNWSNRPILSFSIARLLEPLLGMYRQVAAGSDESFPGVEKGLGLIQKTVEVISDPDAQKQLLPTMTPAQMKGALSKFLEGDALDFAVELYRFRSFYNRPTANQYDPAAQVPAPPPLELEFHEILNLLSDYPALLRMLGLALDFEVAAPNPLPLPSSSPAVRFAPVALPTAPTFTNRLPWTAIEVTALGFYASPKGSDMSRGMLRLGDPALFSVHQVDVDGAAFKAYNLGRSASRAIASDPAATESLPALRGGGLLVARSDRGAQLTQQLASGAAANGALSSGPAPSGIVVENNLTFHAEDLTRGYRVEVQSPDSPAGNAWFSLCLRSGVYEVGASKFSVDKASLDREGFVRGGNATSAPGSTTGPLYAHETLFGWQGWSLAAPRPGRSIAPFQDPGAPAPKDLPVFVDPLAPSPLGLRADLRAEPGSLPRLRFGRNYRLRARTVDLAGNSLPPGAAPELPLDAWATDVVQFLRHEPIPPPAFTPRLPVAEGESIEHLVIRSDFDRSAAQLDLVSEVTGQPFSPACERHLTPPKASQIQVELHGMLDKLWSDPKATYALSAREAGNLFQLEGGQLSPPHSLLPGEAPTTLEQAARGDALRPGQYFYLDQGSFQVPFLPDPLVGGLLFRGAVVAQGGPQPGVEFLSLAYKESWPELSSRRLILQEATSGGPKVEASSDGVVVSLPKGTMVQLRVSSVPTSVDTLALAKGLPVATQKSIARGSHWMFTPPRTITLVHAVQRPLQAPTLTLGSVARPAGGTSTQLTGELTLHSGSTQRIDIRADWEDPVDDPALPEPTTEAFRAVAASLEIRPGEDNFKIDLNVTDPRLRLFHELNDTRARVVRYAAEAVSRFREYFPPGLFNQPGAFTRESTGAFDSQVLSSARPEPPVVAYAVPTFLWSEGSGSRSRTARSLRLYLERPWFSSGAGEQLAVLITPAAPAGAAPPRYASYWAADPAWNTPMPANNPLLKNSFANGELKTAFDPFANVVSELYPLAEYEVSATPFKDPTSIVVYTPVFHPERKLWYVDIDLKDTGAPYVFVRLQVARYQPDSILGAAQQGLTTGKHLSTSVQVDFVQILPDRSVSLATNSTSFTVLVTGSVAANDRGKAAAGGQTGATAIRNSYFFSARLQRRTTGSGEIGWSEFGAEVELLAGSGGANLLAGTVPRPIKQNGYEYRLLVREFELWTPDPSLGLPTPQRRLVFAAPFSI